MGKVIGIIIFAIIISAVVFGLAACVLQFAWNGAHGLHTLFAANEISFTTALDAAFVIATAGLLWRGPAR